MAVVPYMPFYVADYMADTAHLTTLEHGAYLLLIMAYWQSKKPLRALNGRLANVARLSDENWQLVQPTLAEFFIERDGFWVHKRIEAELAHFRHKSEQASNAGKASAARRRNARSTDAQRASNHTDADADVNVRSLEELLVIEALSRTEEERPENDDGVTERRRAESRGPGKEAVSSQPSSSPDPQSPEFRRMGLFLHDYMAMSGTSTERKYKKPDGNIVNRCLEAVAGTPLDDVGKYLHDRYSNFEQSPRHPNGPKGYAWFESVLAAQFGSREKVAA